MKRLPFSALVPLALAALSLTGCGGVGAPSAASYRGNMPDNDTILRGEVVLTVDDRENVFGTIRDGGRVYELRGEMNGTSFRGDAGGVYITGNMSGNNNITAAWQLDDRGVRDSVTFGLNRL